MQNRKKRFSQTLPEQRPRWTNSKNISFRSFRFLFIFLEFFFVFCAPNGLNWHRNRAFSGSCRLKSGSVLEKIKPGNQTTLFPLLIAGEKFERKLNLNFWQFIFKFMLHDRGNQLWIWTKFKAQKSTLVHGFTQRDYTLGKNNHFNYTSGKKKLG